jgi:cytochrome P450
MHTSDLDPFADAFLADPYPAHDTLRELGPVVRLETHGVFAMARHEHVHAALNEWETYVSSAGVGLANFRKEKPFRRPSLLLEADPPAHTQARKTITGVLSPRRVKQLKETFAREADALVDRLVAQGTFDAVADFAHAFPNTVFPTAVGVPEEGRENLMAYAHMVFNAFGPQNALFLESARDAGPVSAWITDACRRENLADGGLGADIHAHAEETGMTSEQAMLLVRSLLTAGVDTTVHGIGNAMLALATHPEQYAALHADPGRARAAFEEAVRFESPVQTFFRTTTRDVAVEGETIPAGEKVLLFLAAANRDGRHWDDPDAFDIGRRASGHAAFGAGIHACVGQMLARLEAEVLLGALARRVEAIELVGEPVVKLNNTLRGYASVPVTVRPAHA